MEPSVTCVDDVTRLQYCWMCRGQVTSSSTRRCRGHCSHVVRDCLSVHADVNTAWNDYLRTSVLPVSSLSSCLSVCLPVCPYTFRHLSRLTWSRIVSITCMPLRKQLAYVACYVRSSASYKIHLSLLMLNTSSSQQSQQLLVPPFRLTTVGRRSFPVASSLLWNSLPSDIQSSPSLPVFHQRLKHFFFDDHFLILYCDSTMPLWTS